MIDYQAIWNEVTAQFFDQNPDSIHGPSHWHNVEDVGLKIARLTGADPDVVRLFAVFHDSRRVSNNHDPDHGLRAGDYVMEARGRLFDLDDARFKLLRDACRAHADGDRAADITIGTCFDADRLDLRRIGIKPDPAFISNWQVRNMLKASASASPQ
jgi:uncharacterized protein